MMLQCKNRNRRAQDKKSKITSLPFKKGQEEMVGFAFIIIIVAVILIIFISFSLTKQSVEIKSYEVESFMHAMVQYTSNCSDARERLSIQKLIFRCKNTERCSDDRNTCDVLNSTLQGLLFESWKIKNTPIQGYNLTILSENKVMITIADGNQTKNFKGSTLKLPKEVDVYFNAYY